MNEIPIDIMARILRDFGDEESAVVEQDLLELMLTLQQYKVAEYVRVARCVVQYAAGDWKRLEYALEIAQTDYRDAIMFGEYETVNNRLERVRDLSRPFES